MKDLYELEKYYNHLDLRKFSMILSDYTQCYKYYWLESLIKISVSQKIEITFDEIINKMICEVWFVVTRFHLKLGVNIRGTNKSLLEEIVSVLSAKTKENQIESDSMIEYLIKEHASSILPLKRKLIQNVPFRTLSPFLNISGNNPIWNKKKDTIELIKKINEEDPLPYTIGAFEGLNTKIYINPEWGNFFRDQYFLLLGWIQFHKCVYIQSKNSGVPNIIAKVSWKNNGIRKLKLVRDLWVEISKTSAEQIYSIYTGEPINFKNFDLDHFIPWSYIGNDELWNLVPTEPYINSSKSNHLPRWDVYIKRFVDVQWFLYCSVFSNEEIRFKFDRCRQDNLNEIWASELLFVPGRTKEEFKNILIQNIRPIYNSAELQGFTIWMYE